MRRGINTMFELRIADFGFRIDKRNILDFKPWKRLPAAMSDFRGWKAAPTSDSLIFDT